MNTILRRHKTIFAIAISSILTFCGLAFYILANDQGLHEGELGELFSSAGIMLVVVLCSVFGIYLAVKGRALSR